MELNTLTIAQAHEGLRQKKFSVTELVSACLAAIRLREPELHAYIEYFQDAEKESSEADAMLNANRENLPPLFGIPLAIKDNILLKGRRATAGSKILADYIAPYDATVISKLKKQGAIFLGKTNLDEFAMGSSTENSSFGPTKNPHDVSRVPGGSSGGSAAAVAANLALAALGSDTGGSIRQPASFCGIVGMKPTYGRVSRHGLIAMASSLDQIGPMAKTVADAEILYNAIIGKDAFDATVVAEDELVPPQKLNEITIGIPKEYFSAGLDNSVAVVIQKAIHTLEKEGARIKEISLPHASYALPAYYIIVPSEVSTNMARFDGIRYGFQTAVAETLHETYTKTRKEGFGQEVKRRIMLGTYALSAGYYDAYYVKAQKVRRLIRNDFETAFRDVTILLGPTTPTAAFVFGEHAKDPLQMYLADIYTVAVNLAGIPALSLPAGFTTENNTKLPVGLQLIGNWFHDRELLGIAKLVEQAFDLGK